MDLKGELKNLIEQEPKLELQLEQIEPEEIYEYEDALELCEKKGVKLENLDIKIMIDFPTLKELIIDKLKNDRILKPLRLKVIDQGISLIIFQGVRTNVLGRINRSGKHIIGRSQLNIRLGNLLEFKIKRN